MARARQGRVWLVATILAVEALYLLWIVFLLFGSPGGPVVDWLPVVVAHVGVVVAVIGVAVGGLLFEVDRLGAELEAVRAAAKADDSRRGVSRSDAPPTSQPVAPRAEVREPQRAAPRDGEPAGSTARRPPPRSEHPQRDPSPIGTSNRDRASAERNASKEGRRLSGREAVETHASTAGRGRPGALPPASRPPEPVEDEDLWPPSYRQEPTGGDRSTDWMPRGPEPAASSPRSPPPPGPAAVSHALAAAWERYSSEGDGYFDPEGLGSFLDAELSSAGVVTGAEIGFKGSLLAVTVPGIDGLFLLPDFNDSPREVATWFDVEGAASRTSRVQRLIRPAYLRRTARGDYAIERRGTVS